MSVGIGKEKGKWNLDLGVKGLNIAIEHPKIKLFYHCPKVMPETMYWESRLSHIHT